MSVVITYKETGRENDTIALPVQVGIGTPLLSVDFQGNFCVVKAFDGTSWVATVIPLERITQVTYY